jgi:hypothetical protein
MQPVAGASSWRRHCSLSHMHRLRRYLPSRCPANRWAFPQSFRCRVCVRHQLQWERRFVLFRIVFALRRTASLRCRSRSIQPDRRLWRLRFQCSHDRRVSGPRRSDSGRQQILRCQQRWHHLSGNRDLWRTSDYHQPRSTLCDRVRPITRLCSQHGDRKNVRRRRR